MQICFHRLHNHTICSSIKPPMYLIKHCPIWTPSTLSFSLSPSLPPSLSPSQIFLYFQHLNRLSLLFKETVFISVVDPIHVQDFSALVSFKSVSRRGLFSSFSFSFCYYFPVDLYCSYLRKSNLQSSYSCHFYWLNIIVKRPKNWQKTLSLILCPHPIS